MSIIAEHTNQALVVTVVGYEYDFVSRFFGPNVGVPEDPVTGSSHCMLASYWETRLQKSRFHAYQASKRGGELWVEISGERCFISGKAITVFKGALNR